MSVSLATSVTIKNDSGEEIPRRSFVQVSGYEKLDNGKLVILVVKPDGDGTVFYVTGGSPIGIDKTGTGYNPSFPVWVKYGTEPTPVVEVGPGTGDWEMTTGGSGFACIGVDTDKEMALVQSLGGGGGTGGGGGSSTTTTTPCCSVVNARGSVDLLDLEWATDYDVACGDLGTIVVTHQDGYWESDDIEVVCEEGTDIYKLTMTPSGVGAGQIELVLEFVSGGGYGGDPACCSEPLAWRYVNYHLVDPLAQIPFTRDPTGFAGRQCDPGPCHTCAMPTNATTSDCFYTDSEELWDEELPRFYRVELSGIEVADPEPGDCNPIVGYDCDNFNLTTTLEKAYGAVDCDPGSGTYNTLYGWPSSECVYYKCLPDNKFIRCDGDAGGTMHNISLLRYDADQMLFALRSKNGSLSIYFYIPIGDWTSNEEMEFTDATITGNCDDCCDFSGITLKIVPVYS